jgi:galacturan 1,4-alpha-galacturonidase
MICNASDYGAVGDGKTNDTSAVQRAIDDCAAAGGGTVNIAGGRYLIGTITLKSGIELHVSHDGVLLGSPRCEDYPEHNNSRLKSSDLPRGRSGCLIYAEDCDNIAITGRGIIDGNGENFVTLNPPDIPGPHYRRINAPTPPRVVFFVGCKNVKVTDVRMINQPAGWSYWISDCEDVAFDRCKIEADVQYPNNDGIHINSSRNVSVSNCNIVCGDDCIIVRANNYSLPQNKICERITVTNCTLTSYSGGIRIGWICDGTIRNCAFSNIVMTDTSCGISIYLPRFSNPRTSDQGRENTLIENITFSNIIMDGVYAHPIYIKIDDDPPAPCTRIRSLYFNQIHARGLEFPYISGRKDCPVRDIGFSGCTFEKLNEKHLPDRERHGVACGNLCLDFPIRFAENVVFDNTSFTTREQ